VIRINSQSGKGGVAYVMLHDFGFDLPRAMQIEFGKVVQALSEETGAEIMPAAIVEAFEREYLANTVPYELVDYHVAGDGAGSAIVNATVRDAATLRKIVGGGNGPIDAFVQALRSDLGLDVAVRDYHEHAVGSGADATAVAYVEVVTEGCVRYGVGRDRSIVTASLRAVLSGINRTVAVAGFDSAAV
jgi:2-isopropylmalate synthase